MVTDLKAVKELKFSVNGLNFSAQEWGLAGQTPVLAVHGWLDNSASFNRLAEQLNGVHLVAIDLAGHGQTDHRSDFGCYNIWQDVPDIFAIADSLGWQRFCLLGHSRGAIISMLAAGTFPERIDKLALIEGLWPEPVDVMQAPQQLAKAIRQTVRLKNNTLPVYDSKESAIAARQAGRFPLSYCAASAIVSRGLKVVGDGYSWSTDPCLLAPSAVKLTQAHLHAFVERISAPIQLFLGESGIKHLLEGYQEQIDLIDNLETILLPGGHHLHMETEANLVAAKLQSFF